MPDPIFVNNATKDLQEEQAQSELQDKIVQDAIKRRKSRKKPQVSKIAEACGLGLLKAGGLPSIVGTLHGQAAWGSGKTSAPVSKGSGHGTSKLCCKKQSADEAFNQMPFNDNQVLDKLYAQNRGLVDSAKDLGVPNLPGTRTPDPAPGKMLRGLGEAAMNGLVRPDEKRKGTYDSNTGKFNYPPFKHPSGVLDDYIHNVSNVASSARQTLTGNDNRSALVRNPSGPGFVRRLQPNTNPDGIVGDMFKDKLGPGSVPGDALNNMLYGPPKPKVRSVPPEPTRGPSGGPLH